MQYSIGGGKGPRELCIIDVKCIMIKSEFVVAIGQQWKHSTDFCSTKYPVVSLNKHFIRLNCRFIPMRVCVGVFMCLCCWVCCYCIQNKPSIHSSNAIESNHSIEYIVFYHIIGFRFDYVANVYDYWAHIWMVYVEKRRMILLVGLLLENAWRYFEKVSAFFFLKNYR